MNPLWNPKLTPVSKALRKRMTPQERHLWYDFLKGLSVTVHRQRPLGSYIVDFYIPSVKTVIELDGSQHYEPSHHIVDRQRDAALRAMGLQVLRYTNLEIDRDFSAVCTDILNRTGLKTPSP